MGARARRWSAAARGRRRSSVLGFVAVPAAAGRSTVRRRRAVIGCDQAANRIQVTVSSVLDPSCTYTAGFDITASDVTLDCRGALIQKAGGGIGILVQTPADVDMADVTIRNCRVDGFLNSIHLRRAGLQRAARRPRVRPPPRRRQRASTASSPARAGSGSTSTATSPTRRSSTSSSSVPGSDGIYLDAGSRYGRVVENVVVWNGYRENGPTPEGTVTRVRRRHVPLLGPGSRGHRGRRLARQPDREQLDRGATRPAACSSTRTAARTCTRDPANWVEHRFGAEDNTVVGNLITGGGTGVWIGSRMARERVPDGLQRRAVRERPDAGDHARPRAAHHRAEQRDRRRRLRRAGRGRRRAHRGQPHRRRRRSRHAVIVGTPYRTTVLGHPVTDTIVKDNVSTIVGNPARTAGSTASTRSRRPAQHRARRAVGVLSGARRPARPVRDGLRARGAGPERPAGARSPTSTIPRLGALAALLTASPRGRDLPDRRRGARMRAVTDAPWTGDACSLVDAFRSGERSPTEELDATFAAIDASRLNAFCHLDREWAYRAAAGGRRVEAVRRRAHRHQGARPGARAGRSARGRSSSPDRVADRTSHAIERLLDAGRRGAGRRDDRERVRWPQRQRHEDPRRHPQPVALRPHRRRVVGGLRRPRCRAGS